MSLTITPPLRCLTGDELTVMWDAFDLACADLAIQKDDAEQRDHLVNVIVSLANAGVLTRDTLKHRAVASFLRAQAS